MSNLSIPYRRALGCLKLVCFTIHDVNCETNRYPLLSQGLSLEWRLLFDDERFVIYNTSKRLSSAKTPHAYAYAAGLLSRG